MRPGACPANPALGLRGLRMRSTAQVLEVRSPRCCVAAACRWQRATAAADGLIPEETPGARIYERVARHLRGAGKKLRSTAARRDDRDAGAALAADAIALEADFFHRDQRPGDMHWQ
jgi:hypothetical protein